MSDRPLLLTEDAGREALEWLRENPWHDPPLEVLVSTRAYSRRIDPEWVPVDGVAPGTAAAYPVKGRVPGFGGGQWKFGEVLAVRVTPLGRELPGWPFPRDAHDLYVNEALR